MKLTLNKETLAELTADDMAAVVGAGDGDSNSCSIASCVTNNFRATLSLVVNVDICDVN